MKALGKLLLAAGAAWVCGWAREQRAVHLSACMRISELQRLLAWERRQADNADARAAALLEQLKTERVHANGLGALAREALSREVEQAERLARVVASERALREEVECLQEMVAPSGPPIDQELLEAARAVAELRFCGRCGGDHLDDGRTSAAPLRRLQEAVARAEKVIAAESLRWCRCPVPTEGEKDHCKACLKPIQEGGERYLADGRLVGTHAWHCDRRHTVHEPCTVATWAKPHEPAQVVCNHVECDGSNWCPCECHGWPTRKHTAAVDAGEMCPWAWEQLSDRQRALYRVVAEHAYVRGSAEAADRGRSASDSVRALLAAVDEVLKWGAWFGTGGLASDLRKLKTARAAVDSPAQEHASHG